MGVNDYNFGSVKVKHLSSLSVEEGRALVGKTINSIDADTDALTIGFTDGTSMYCSGYDSDLDIIVNDPVIPR
jgi:hypothetical protein